MIISVLLFSALLFWTSGAQGSEPQECLCTDSLGQTHNFCYSSPNVNGSGIAFNCSHMNVLENLNLLKTAGLPQTEIHDPVFVMAISQSHFQEGLRLIASIRKFFKRSSILVYDIGLNNHSREKIAALCFIELKEFDFDAYPAYVKNLREYRWKPIVIADALMTHPAIWYMDSSVIITKQTLTRTYWLTTCNKTNLVSKERDLFLGSPYDSVQYRTNAMECVKSRFLLHGYSGHGTFAATDPMVYKYFPVDFSQVKKPLAKMMESGLIFVNYDETTRSRILKWWVLCALDRDCMANHQIPNVCRFDVKDPFGNYGRCHRFDQSVANTLLLNEFNYEARNFASELYDFFRIERNFEGTVKSSSLSCDVQLE